MALFVFSAQQLADVLQKQVQAGVNVRLVADPGPAAPSQKLDLLGVALPDHARWISFAAWCSLTPSSAPSTVFNRQLQSTVRHHPGDAGHG